MTTMIRIEDKENIRVNNREFTGFKVMQFEDSEQALSGTSRSVDRGDDFGT
jgi:hypothetical protein